MPIRPEFRKFYGRKWRTEIRPRILARARNKCERCGVANYEVGIRERNGMFRPVPVRKRRGYEIRIVLTVAHLNHVPGDDRDENLQALCQYHHLRLDAEHHRETRATRKDRARPVLVAAAGQ
jgi:hypothetical protein